MNDKIRWDDLMPSGRMVTVNSRRYYVDIQHSPAPGIPVLLLHGFVGSTRDWDHVSASLSHKHKKIIRVDLPGHGNSSLPPMGFSLPQAAEEIAQLLDLIGVAKSILIGYSMGGRIALHLALMAPERFTGLILESSTYGIKDVVSRHRRREDDQRLAAQIRTYGTEWFVGEWEKTPLFESQIRLSPDVRHHQRKDRLQRDAEGLARALETMGTGTQSCLFDRLPDLYLPTLLMAGALDDKFRRIADEMKQTIPRSKMEIIPGAGHNVHLEQPDRFVRAVTNFAQHIDPR